MLVELWTDPTILEGNLEQCPKGYKTVHTLWSSNTTTAPVSQRDNKKGKGPTCTKIFIAALFCSGKKLEIKGLNIHWGMAEEIAVHAGGGILSCYKEW